MTETVKLKQETKYEKKQWNKRLKLPKISYNNSLKFDGLAFCVTEQLDSDPQNTQAAIDTIKSFLSL